MIIIVNEMYSELGSNENYSVGYEQSPFEAERVVTFTRRGKEVCIKPTLRPARAVTGQPVIPLPSTRAHRSAPSVDGRFCSK